MGRGSKELARLSRFYMWISFSVGIQMDLVFCSTIFQLTKHPLFPGDSEIDQLFRIFRTLGTSNGEAFFGHLLTGQVVKKNPSFFFKNDRFFFVSKVAGLFLIHLNFTGLLAEEGAFSPSFFMQKCSFQIWRFWKIGKRTAFNLFFFFLPLLSFSHRIAFREV